MARRTPQEAIIQDVITVALRQRRFRLVAIAVALALLAGSAIWSHRTTPPDPAPLDGQTVTVDRVVDGDTLIVSGSGFVNERLRLLGIDAPEVAHPDFDHDAHFGPEAKRYLTQRLAGKTVTLKFDATEKRDRFGRLLGYVYLGDSDCINVDLVRDGMAYADRRFKTMLAGTLEQNENNARTKGIGLWKGLKPRDMPEWRQRWFSDRDRGTAK